ncbi:MAG TPA: hybrid sensor histidine kinase/response regulator [Gemmatimonas aurantiaca]|uniref:histidine kinase n=2 Tax=Gemmatimonas aurantiaca TaxID=173480 RepID=C1ACS7_GEMAT|nr:ATP-binding protein [Gemmatimonas aurantiaca]BAH40304.1 putative two-component hybrid sensor and regulator [Gemmatimonas aurantiaca T-27]HCT57686.1 hybrid sensor histidine kinase/response regulator [Gemmatimonas aurantiaca]
MRRRPISIALKFPLLITGIVLTTSALLVWATYQHFSAVLHDSAEARLRSSGVLLASSLADSYTAARAQLLAVANHPHVREHLSTGQNVRGVDSILAVALATTDSARLQIRVLDLAGREHRIAKASHEAVGAPWAVDTSMHEAFSSGGIRVSPLLDVGGVVEYEMIAPVHTRDDGESHVGYIVETRRIRAQGVDAVRGIVGTSAMLMGQPGSSVWTDFQRVVREPAVMVRPDSIARLVGTDGRPAISIAERIGGSPWVVWLEYEEDRILAPLRSFVERMIPITVLVALLGALFAWAFSRKIANRLVVITRQFDDVNAHQPSGAVREAGRDEIHLLEESFLAMSQRAERQAQLESQLMQSQKLEAVGRLAGGIAHDFNNMLTVVRNYAEMVRSELEPESPMSKDMDEILHATSHAAQLIRQLLAFSRQQILQPVRLDLNDVIRNAHRMLQRVLPSHVEFRLDLGHPISTVLADPGQIEQVLMNLTVNASDAMPQGGRLTFRTTMSELDDTTEPAAAGVVGARRYVCLTVVDTGIGMDHATTARIFEPFFTTKPVGKGTGLGLAGVHGIIAQLGGSIWVYSQPGRGTTFKVYLPAAEGAADPVPRAGGGSPLIHDSGTILLVEDDPSTRGVIRRLLERHGFDVVEAANGVEAIAQLDDVHERVRLVLSDVMMPELNGMALANIIAERWPTMPVMLMSGYTDADIPQQNSGALKRTFIEKPFTSGALLHAVMRELYTTEDVLKPR